MHNEPKANFLLSRYNFGYAFYFADVDYYRFKSIIPCVVWVLCVCCRVLTGLRRWNVGDTGACGMSGADSYTESPFYL